jgi:hypothetical protein
MALSRSLLRAEVSRGQCLTANGQPAWSARRIAASPRLHQGRRAARGREVRRVELSEHYADVPERRLRAELTQDDFALAGPEA